MKTKQQKAEQIEKGRELIKDAKAILFADFSSLPSEEMRKLRRELIPSGSKLFVIKKRLLKLILKEKGLGAGALDNKTSVGAIFAPKGLEGAAAPVWKFFKALKIEKEKVLGGVDLEKGALIPAADVAFIGELPPREVLLGQLVGMLISPIRSLAFVIDQKAKKSE